LSVDGLAVDSRYGRVVESITGAPAGIGESDRAKANASLIAAVHELYAVAQMVVEFDGPGGTDSPMAEAARAAVAKARGEG